MAMHLLALLLALSSGSSSTAVANEGFTPAESLIAAITMEGLLFAAFSVGTKLTDVTEEGRSPFFSQAWFGWCVVGVIAVVAAAAIASWWEVFSSEGWTNLGHLLLAVGLALGILAQPVFAAVINVESKTI